MDNLGRELAQGDQRKLPLVHFRVRDLEALLVHDQRIVKQDVEIDDARPPAFAHFLAPHRPLDILALLEQQFGL